MLGQICGQTIACTSIYLAAIKFLKGPRSLANLARITVHLCVFPQSPFSPTLHLHCPLHLGTLQAAAISCVKRQNRGRSDAGSLFYNILMDFSVGAPFWRVYPNEVTLSLFNVNLYLSLSLVCNCTYLTGKQASTVCTWSCLFSNHPINLAFISQRCNNAGIRPQ